MGKVNDLAKATFFKRRKVLKGLNIHHIGANPGSSFRSLHESIVNYGGNKKPELITCLHEESSVAIAHGYAKAAGKPMAVMLHGTVGLHMRRWRSTTHGATGCRS